MNRIVISSRRIASLILFAGGIAPALPAVAHSDFFLTNVGGQVAVGGANELESSSPFFDLDTQVFEGVLVTGFPLPLVDYGRGEPGFFALPAGSPDFPAGAAALVGNAVVSVNLPSFAVNGQTDTLFYWNGSGAVDFQPISTTQPDVTLSIDPSPFSDLTGADGFLHFHTAFELDNGGAGVPADGVYLAAPTVSVAGMADSKPFYLVLLADQLLVDDDAAEGLEETFEAGETFYEAVGKDFGFYEEAVAYVESNIVVPEPATALLGGIAMVGILSFRPRRRVVKALP